jgi:hypothetical protein
VPTWLRSVVNAISGKVPGKTSRIDTATRMAMDADFSDRREPTPQGEFRGRERDLEELIRIVDKAQAREAEDERRLYHPMRGDRPSFFQRRRRDRG